MTNQLIGFRKLLLVFVVVGLSTVLLGLKIISPENWVELNKFVVPAFLAANLIQKFKSGRETQE